MAKVYADLIRKGKKTLDDVPEKLKAEVQKMTAKKLFVDGYYLCNPYH